MAMKNYIPRRITTRGPEQGPAYTSSNGRVWVSWGGDIYAFMVALGRFSFSIDAHHP
jgi:hypothetical protein